jgi:hypothetical protein
MSAIRSTSFRPFVAHPHVARREAAIARSKPEVSDGFEAGVKMTSKGSGPSLMKIVPGSPDAPPATHDYAQNDGTNSCGTTALCVALLRLGHKEISRDALDRSIRNGDLFTAPEDLVSEARELGFDASLQNHGSFDQLRDSLGKGRQLVALIGIGGGRNAEGDLTPGTGAHYVTITKAYLEKGEQMVEFVSWGKVEKMKYSDFEKLWSDVKPEGMPTGFNRMFMMVDDPKRAGYRPLPPSHLAGAQTALLGATVIADAVNGWAKLKDGRVFGGLTQLLMSGVGAAFALPGTALFLAGEYVSKAGSAVRELGKSLLARPGFFQKAAGVGCVIVGGLVDGAGKLVKAAGNLVSAVGDGICKAAKAVGKFFRGIFG